MNRIDWPSWIRPGLKVRGPDGRVWTVASIGIVKGEQEFVLSRPNVTARWPLSVGATLFGPVGGGAS